MIYKDDDSGNLNLTAVVISKLENLQASNEKILYSNVTLDQWGNAAASVNLDSNKLIQVLFCKVEKLQFKYSFTWWVSLSTFLFVFLQGERLLFMKTDEILELLKF